MKDAYYSCPWIESRLVFAVEKLLLCCVTNHGRGNLKVSEFEGGDLPLEKIFSFRDQVRYQNQLEGFHPLCEGCGWLEKKVWKKQEYAFDHLTIAHFTLCNLECSYCYVPKGGFHKHPAKPYDVYPILLSLVQRKLLSPKGFVYWGGGEPTLFDDFKKSFDMLLHFGVEQAVSTNATILSETLKDALRKRRVNLVCSIDAGTAETYKKIKKRDFFHRVWRNVGEYTRTGGRVDAKIIVMEENHHEIVPFLDMAQKVGIRNVIYDVNFHEQEPTDRILDAIARLYYEGVLKRGIQVIEGGSGIPAFGEEVRERIRRRLDRMVTWEEIVRFQALIQQSKTFRFARELNKYPTLKKVASKGYQYFERAYLYFKSGFY